MSSIFTKIITREIPQEIIYEDDRAIIIPTIEPITTGHVLVIPKKEVDHLWDLDDDDYAYIQELTKRIARHMRTVYPEYPRIASVVEGFGVPHAHIHVFGVHHGFDTTITEHVANKHAASPEELKAVADALRATPIA